jgi:hypothetical protein
MFNQFRGYDASRLWQLKICINALQCNYLVLLYELLESTMRQLFSFQRYFSARKFEAIATLSVLALGGLVLRPGWSSNVGDPELPESIPPQQQATSSAREEHRQKQTRQIRAENYDLSRFPVQADLEKHWRNILWTTAVVEPQEEFVAAALDRILAMSTQRGLNNSQVRTIDMAMKVSTQLYLSHPGFYQKTGQRFLEIVERSSDPEWVAVALSGLAQSGLSPTEQKRLSEQVKKRFPNWTKNVYLQTTLREMVDAAAPQAVPPVADLLKWQIAPQQVHLYVLCRRDRRVLCRAVLKDREGEFVRTGDRLWSMPLLLESIHGLGWNFTRGQTPQGIYRVEGVVPQPDDEFFRAYGQFDLVNLYVPFEPGAKQFIPGRSGTFAGALNSYQAMLPPTWRDYRPIHQSYWAGKAGRGLFRIHGTGEAPTFFNGKDKNFPDSFEWNPTIGCLSARELYSEQGKLLQADMPKLLYALQTLGGRNFTGYMVVVDVPTDTNQAISLKEVEALVSFSAKGGGSTKNAKKPTIAQQSQALVLRSVSSMQASRSHMDRWVGNLDKLGQPPNPSPLKRTISSPQSRAEPLETLPIAY